MANMPFKMSYSFEGNTRTRPEQNLSGASRKETRELLLNRAHEERQKRQEQRVKLKSTLVIQAHVRSYLIRSHEKQVQRLEFDKYENTLSLKDSISRLLFFYNSGTDNERLFKVCHKLLENQEEIVKQMNLDVSFNWIMRRMLNLCSNCLLYKEMFDMCLQCINVFTDDTKSKARLDIWPYLVSKGLFRNIRRLIDDKDTDTTKILFLIKKPLEILPLLTSLQQTEIILSEFCSHFLCSSITLTVKHMIIPYLQRTSSIFYNDIIKFLKENVCYETTNSLFFCILALEPSDHLPTSDSVQVLSSLSKNLHYMFCDSYDESDEDSDVEAMEVSTSSEHMGLQDFTYLLNNSFRVTRLINFFLESGEDETILISIVQLCHNLLLVDKDSIKKFMLLFMLSLKGKFLNYLWDYIKRNESSFPINGSSIVQWRNIHTFISVFCDMFTFYTKTLTDSDSSDTSATFSTHELCSMAESLKNIALNLIEIAFPMSRSTALYPTTEVVHLYKSCLKCLKILYTLDLRKHFCKANFWTQRKIHVCHDLCRKNYLSKTVCPFYGIVADEEDEHLPPLSTIEQRSLAILQQLPFLIDFNTRVLLLRELCQHAMGNPDIRLRREIMNDKVIAIRRSHLYEDAFNKLSRDSDANFKHRMRIQFINAMGLEEAGIDGGGIFKEFINEVMKTSFDPNRGFFLLTNDNMLYPNPDVANLMENYQDHYYFIGRLLGKTIFESVLVDLPLAEFFLVKLLIDKADSHYLKSLDPILYRNLLYLRDYTGDVQDMDLDFTINSTNLGETKVVELKPNGANIPVTNYNRLEYIHNLADYKLNTQIKKQCIAFSEGLNSVVPLLWLKMFNHYELQVIISGHTQEIDLADLKAHTVYGGEFNDTHQTIILFWEILESFTDAQRKQVLKFVTSCSRPPLLGFKELNPQFCIHPSSGEDRMPTASTCLNLLKIPIIKNGEVLRNKLLSAIEQQAGFELS